MKNILLRSKQLIQDNIGPGQTLQYVQDVEVIHPDISQTKMSIGRLPKILFTPVSTKETWIASQKKQAMHIVTVYLVLLYRQRETEILGDASLGSGKGSGIIDFVNDFITVFRGERFSVGGVPYLDKPMDIVQVKYINSGMSDEASLLVAEITMQCSRLFLQTTLPGDV